MKIIFLDFDGVLNSSSFILNQRKLKGMKGMMKDEDWLNPVMIGRLNAIIIATDAKVVISSDWRLDGTIEYHTKLLKSLGFAGEIINQTPVIPDQSRSEEIQMWLHYSKEIDDEVESFVVLDDDDNIHNCSGVFFTTPIKDRHVLTSMWSGLEDVHVAQAIEILNMPWIPNILI